MMNIEKETWIYNETKSRPRNGIGLIADYVVITCAAHFISMSVFISAYVPAVIR